jgi:Zn ribbon nucleic-acid-binding protein
MPSRWKHDRPMSRPAFNKRFPDDAACARHLFEKRWPNGFVCPKCQSAKAWALDSKPFTYECAACGRQTSVTAGTVFHRSHLSLLTWFLAIYAIASPSNGISALQLQAQLGLGSYKTAWLMLQKLRRAMIDPDRSLLENLVEVDESDIPYRTKSDPIAGGQGRSAVGKLHFIGAIEISPDGHPRRIRLAPLQDFSAPSIGAFVAGAVTPGTTILSDGFSSYRSLKGYSHQPKVVGKMAAHVVLPWIHMWTAPASQGFLAMI